MRKKQGIHIRGVTGTLDSAVMKPTTRVLTRTVKKVPVIGRPLLTPLVRAPRAVTQAGTGIVLAIPKAAGTVANTGFKVAGQVIKAPFQALGAGGALAKLGFSSKSRPKKKKSLRKRK